MTRPAISEFKEFIANEVLANAIDLGDASEGEEVEMIDDEKIKIVVSKV